MLKCPLVIFLLLPLSLFCQAGLSNIEKYTTANGLSDNEITALLQDSKGFLWIGTQWGLNRYDGRSFKQYFKTNSGKMIARISTLAEDAQGLIWIGSVEGVKTLDPLTERVDEVNFSGAAFSDREKKIWLCAMNGTVASVENGTITKKAEVNVAGADIKLNRFILDMYEDHQRNLWFATSNGVVKMNKDRLIPFYYALQTTDSRNACTCIYEDGRGIIWAGTWGSGILKLDTDKNVFENLPIGQTNDFELNTIFSIKSYTYKNKKGFLLGTGGGLIFTKPDGLDKFQIEKRITKGEDDDALNAFDVSHILEDRQGNIWLSTSLGLHKIDKGKQNFSWQKLPGKESRNDMIFHVVESPIYKDSIAYLTTMKGWWKYNLKTQSITKHSVPNKDSFLVSFINRYIPDSNGIWFTSMGGFGYYNLRTGKVVDYTSFIGVPSQVPRCFHIVRDNSGKLWISVFRDGLRVFDPVTLKNETLFTTKETEDIRGQSISAMVYNDKLVWMVAGKKLYRIQAANHHFTSHAVPDFLSLKLDRHNRVLLFDKEHIYEFRNEKLIQLYPSDNSTEYRIESINEDDGGNFWVRTNTGFFKTDLDFKTWTSYNFFSHVAETDISEVYNKDNHFIATSVDKLLDFTVSDTISGQMKAPVILSKLITNDKQILFPGLHQNIQLPYKSRLEIEVAALNFINEKNNRIFYQLKGWDDQWHELSGSSLHYEQLPPGNYTLLLKARNGDVELTSEPAQLVFTIQQPFWRTWWFLGLMAFILVSLAYIIYRYRLKQALKMERLRTRIATDLHDDIGATLSSISMYSEAVKQQVKEKMPSLEPVLDKMGENSRNMVGSMSDIVWAINPENDDAEKMLMRMENYAKDNCSLKNIHLKFIADERLSGLSLTLDQRKNIYLVFKEALNNALKYSNAYSIDIHFEKRGHFLVLTIKDDGKGFNPETVRQGNGLKNLHSRAKEIKGELTIVSGDGTEVQLRCHL